LNQVYHSDQRRQGLRWSFAVKLPSIFNQGCLILFQEQNEKTVEILSAVERRFARWPDFLLGGSAKD
jgi:hypothetical protein